MCILCVIQKWSRRIATMLPWLVIPLIGLWFLSQFLPPAFRFEITSPRLACMFVLLITLFWYEILMPQLSAWRVRRNARVRERKRFEAIEMQKLRKTATRRCRNCLTAYREQNPGGGKFMCSCCGHISRRPVLDLPIPPGLSRLSNSGILKDLVGKGNGWICGQDWLENNGRFSSGGDDDCFAEKSYSRLVVFIWKVLGVFFFCIMWLWRMVFRVNSSDEDGSVDTEINLAKKGENGGNCNESRSEKARRKAEEKRQARLEKEQLEEEERKQREEVARLVEERRKLRDEKIETEKICCKEPPREKTNKRETEKKRQERRKEKDRGCSKSSSDVDELEKQRAVKEIERSKKSEIDRRILTDSVKFNTHNNSNIGSVGTRYLDRMRGSFLSSSRAFTGGGFFGKSTNGNNISAREHNSNSTFDHLQNTPNRRDLSQSDITPAKSNASTEDKTINRPAQVESQPAPKKSWQQLFTRTPTVSSPSSSNAISRPKVNSQKDVQNPFSSSSYQATQGFDNPITFELPNFAYGDPIINTDLHLSSNSVFPRVGESPDKFLPEESDIFEEPCYVPDPVSLIGPVSESLDNFQLDLGFVPDLGFQKPSPIQRHANASFFSDNINGNHDMNNLPTEKGWQMWDSSPIYQDTLSWLNKEEVMQPQSQKTMASLFKKDDDPWMPKTSYGSISGTDKHLSLPNEMVYGSPNGSAINHPFQLSQGNFWAKKERASVPVSVEGKGSASSLTARPVGGLYSTPDVQSLWSYE